MVEWIQNPANIAMIFALWSGLLAAAQVVVRWTPSTKDDGILGSIGSWTEKIRNILTFTKPTTSSTDQQ